MRKFFPLMLLLSACATTKVTAPPTAQPAPEPMPLPETRPAPVGIRADLPEGWLPATGPNGQPLDGAAATVMHLSGTATIRFFIGEAGTTRTAKVADDFALILRRKGAETLPVERDQGSAGFAWRAAKEGYQRSGLVFVWKIVGPPESVVAAVGEWPLELSNEMIDDFHAIVESVRVQ